MENDKLKYGGIGFILGIATVWLVNVTFVNSNNTFMMGRRLNPVGNQKINDTIDAHFIEQMIPHHEGAIEMSNLALENAKRPELKTLAQSIIKSQTAEIIQMKTWYKDWFGKEVPENENTEIGMGRGMMRGGMMGDTTDTILLQEAEDFDRAFVEEMIPHHQMAVMMASMLRNGTERPEMKKLADDIITAQTKEIDVMREWLRNW